MNVTDSGHECYDIAAIRADFPILGREIRGKRLVFLDSAASAQKPRQVIDRVRDVYEMEYANVHRGLHYLSELATDGFEQARRTVATFLNARHEHEIIFTRNTSEALNLVAASHGRANLSPGDEVLITGMEHHSNIVPWQLLRDEKGIVLKVVPVGEDGSFSLEAFRSLVSERTRIVSVTHISNVLGTVVPVREVCRIARAAGAVSVIDGAQAVVHMPVDVQEIDCDFYAFSGHKLYGPSGIGVLYGREALLEAMPPYQGGGEMINSVRYEGSSWAELPHKFEAGTPAIAQAIGLGTAIDYVNSIGLPAIARHERDLLNYATQRLSSVPGLRIYGTVPGKASVISFGLDCAHPHDVSTIIDQNGVAVRAGHHCAQPLMERFGVPAMTRASLALYNDREDIDILVESLDKVREIFA